MQAKIIQEQARYRDLRAQLNKAIRARDSVLLITADIQAERQLDKSERLIAASTMGAEKVSNTVMTGAIF